jgi:hypothetical protein
LESITVLPQNVIAEQNRLEITPDEFVGRATSHPLYGLMKWYMKSRGAVCLTTGVGLRQNMGQSYQLEHDHIFPYSELKAVGFGSDNRLKYALAQEMTNRAILTQVANRSKSSTAAADYLKGVQERFPQALALQCIPEDQALWDLDRYEDFLGARRKVLAQALNQFLANITATAEITAPAYLEQLIAEGENDSLELKSSLRWDYEKGMVNRKLEDVVVKTVAAFANAAGGTLLIGVGKSGEVLGLENDYASLEADRDRFEVHLRNVLNQNFGATFVANKLAISFPTAWEVEICRVDIQRCTDPAIVKQKDQNGQTVEKLYVRSGNSSQEIPLIQMAAWLAERSR